MNEDLFGSIKQTITETAGAVGKKTEEFVETQKMRNKVRTLQREIRKKYADVGEIVYKRYVDGDTMDEELTGHCEVVMGLQKELAECKESMAAKQGKNVCPACGISNPKDAVFCMYCGTELPGEEEEKEEEWFTQGPVEETEDQESKRSIRRHRLFFPREIVPLPGLCMVCMPERISSTRMERRGFCSKKTASSHRA